MNALPVIVIQSELVRTISRDGKQDLYFQPAYFERGDGVVLPVEVSLGTRLVPHKPGRYTMSLSSFVPGKYGSVDLRLELGAPLAPAKA